MMINATAIHTQVWKQTLHVYCQWSNGQVYSEAFGNIWNDVRWHKQVLNDKGEHCLTLQKRWRCWPLELSGRPANVQWWHPMNSNNWNTMQKENRLYPTDPSTHSSSVHWLKGTLLDLVAQHPAAATYFKQFQQIFLDVMRLDFLYPELSKECVKRPTSSHLWNDIMSDLIYLCHGCPWGLAQAPLGPSRHICLYFMCTANLDVWMYWEGCWCTKKPFLSSIRL